MQLHQRFSNLVHKETDRLLKSFLSDNPDLLKKYVEGSVATIGAILGPINSFMRHLLTVQGLDPDSVPGETHRLQLQEALNNFFSSTHEDAFDADYDLSWVQKRFEDTRKKLNQLEMTKEQFMGLTDLSKLPNLGSKLGGPFTIDGDPSAIDELSEINQIADESAKREIDLAPVAKQERENQKTVFDPGDAIQALRDAVKAMEAELGVEKKKKGIKTSKKKANKTVPAKTVKKGRGTKVQRVVSTESVKEGPSTLQVESDRKVRPPSTRAPGRSLHDIAQNKRTQAKIAKESTPEFQAEMKARLARATQLTNLMVEKGLLDVDDKSRQDQISSMINWTNNNFDALERVITKYAPTKDAVAENKFKGSFRRVNK